MTRHKFCKLLPMLLLVVGACSVLPEHGDESAPKPAPDVNAMLQRIHAAAAKDQSAILVAPLRSPGVVILQQQAASAMIKGDMDTAAAKLQQALQLEPDSPPLLQAQAELALHQHHWQRAEEKAMDSWKHGPQVGAGCASNWQTVIEVRRLTDDAAGADSAGKFLQRCHAEGVHRY